ncbi:arginyltransferase [Marinobacterium sp. D7]|uniref:arginyltransferase n=1 Tax=Marinobacterium ramblicola TaxID=2849041 RepID=UPI001C2DA458|nr:arginyltransferase [Marinobacterium ramblicola]MBV1786602.1 arginyltransferase [Marinobacterium ramblicola]
MSDLQTLRFYATPPHDCSYLPGRKAKTLFVDPQAEVDGALYSQLSDLGFRRSGSHIYRPHCDSCNACVSVRIPVREFTPSKTQRRIWRRNSDLTVKRVAPQLTIEYYRLYDRYITERHADGDMYPPSPSQFMSFLVEGRQPSTFYEFRDRQNELVAIAVTDQLDQGLSALYTFYAPVLEKRSLGTYAILWQIESARQAKLDYLYLGYWVRDCRKMNYKTAYHPLDMLIADQWIRV